MSPRLKQVMWFIALWAIGVGTLAVVGTLLKLLL
jgi:hypothetical protein